MSQNDNYAVSVAMLVGLCDEPEAVRIIAERLRVKEMGPADHIRTKHEIKAFVLSGNTSKANELIKRAQARRESNRSAAVRHSQQQRRSIPQGRIESVLIDFARRSRRLSSSPDLN